MSDLVYNGTFAENTENCKELREIVTGYPDRLINTICKDCEGFKSVNWRKSYSKEIECETCEGAGILQTLEPITISQMLAALDRQRNRRFIFTEDSVLLVITYNRFSETKISLGRFDKTKEIDQQSLGFKTALLELLKNNE